MSVWVNRLDHGYLGSQNGGSRADTGGSALRIGLNAFGILGERVTLMPRSSAVSPGGVYMGNIGQYLAVYVGHHDCDARSFASDHVQHVSLHTEQEKES